MLVKVKSSKLDELIDVVGELVTRMAGSHAAAQSNDPATLKELFQGMNELVEQIRDRALNLRMVPIGEVFQRFPRLVRDVSQEIGKQIDLEMNGADTELDKSMVEKLADPLVHIVRNAMDHGIEDTEQRATTDKPARGKISLNAFHQSGSIVIEIRDDGRGLNKARIFGKAVERGLIAADAKLADKEIFELIFLPGFSTAETVTDLSGRGVNIDALRGSIDIQSEEGRGTTMQIRLPLTLAIIDGFQVAVGDSDFVLPLSMVEECLELQTTAVHQKIFDLRGQPLPYIRLADIFQLAPAPVRRQCLIVVKVGDSRAGIIVDRFVGELQAVIKPLGQLLQGVAGFSGSTILGDGRVALLLDVPMLLTQASQRDAGHNAIRDVAQATPAPSIQG
jgi:two-component system chemotaxis sensor kinase CheA